MKLVVELLLYIGLIYVLVTYIILPLFFPQHFKPFWDKATPPPPSTADLDTLLQETKHTVEQYNQTKEKVEKTEETVKHIKSHFKQ